MNFTKLRIQILSIAFVSIFLIGLIPPAVMAGQDAEISEEVFRDPRIPIDLDRVYIFYDQDDPTMREIAEGVDEIVSYRIATVNAIPIASLIDLRFWLTDEPWIAIYAFNSNATHVHFNERSIQWYEFYDLIGQRRSTQHVLGMGNTITLSHVWDGVENVYSSDSEVVDAFILVVHDIWSVAEIAKKRGESNYLAVGEDLEKIALQIYADNFAGLIERTIEPVNSVGEMDPISAEDRWQRMADDHPSTIRPVAYRVSEDGDKEQYELDDLPEDYSPMLTISSQAELSQEDLVVGEIPRTSGLRGPMGKIADKVLNEINKQGSTILSIPHEAHDDIFDAFAPLGSIITDDYNDENELKASILAVKEQFPAGHAMKDLLEPMLKALFNMRGEPGAIISSIRELITSFLPSEVPTEIIDWMMGTLNFNAEFFTLVDETKSEGKGAFSAVLGHMMSNILGTLFNKTLAATLGVTTGLADYVQRGTVLFTCIADYLASLDFDRFTENVGTNLLRTTLGAFSFQDGDDICLDILAVVKVGLTAVELIDVFQTEYVATALEELVLELADGPLGLHAPDGLVNNLMLVVQDVHEATTPMSVSEFRSEISSILNTNLTASEQASFGDTLEDTMTMLASFYNPNFGNSIEPTMFDISETILSSNDLDTPDHDDATSALENGLKPVLAAVAVSSDSSDLKEMISGTVNDFDTEFGSVSDVVSDTLETFDLDNVLDGIPDVEESLDTFGDIADDVFNILNDAIGNSFQGILDGVLVAVTSFFGSHPWFDDVTIDTVKEIIENILEGAEDVEDAVELAQKIAEIFEKIAAIIALLPAARQEAADYINGAIRDGVEAFKDGAHFALDGVIDWLQDKIGYVLRIVEDAINGSFNNLNDMLGFDGLLGIDIGDWSFFDMDFGIFIRPNFRFLEDYFFNWLRSLILDGKDWDSWESLGDFANSIFFAWEISPTLHIDFSITAFDASHNDFIEKLFDLLGGGSSFSGYAHTTIRLFTLRNLRFVKGNYLDLLDWSFGVRISINLGMSLLDILIGGAGGGVLEKLGEFIGLNTIGINLWFSFELDIMVDNVDPKSSSLSWLVTMGASIAIGLDLVIVGIQLYGSIEIIISYARHRAEGFVLPIRKGVRIILTLKLKLIFLLWNWKKTWTWEWGQPEDLQVDSNDPNFNRSEMGPDADNDGLSDSFEMKYEGLDMNNPDSDNDGVDDYHEVMIMDSCPSDPDSDDDGLTDAEEWDLATNWLEKDTEFDGLDDYREVKIYGTSPFSFDTDGDGLTDRYEIFHSWNMTGITPTVEYVTIGGVKYDDHTDPLLFDTDGDSIADGSEGPMGPHYGMQGLYNETPEAGLDPAPLIFNDGYTHPLDADTDDDSYLQLYDGEIDRALMQILSPPGTQGLEYPMNDGNEIRGFTVTLYDEEGEPYEKRIYTNPCNPDTDGDTGVTLEERVTPPPGAWLRSDGYELAQTPPSDPTDGDSDDDGLIDGLEGILRQDSNHTFYLDSDTDDDGLSDLVDMLLGTNPLSPDSDLDMIPDGDEFFVFGTNPCLPDTDFDGVSDGEEVYFWHTNPHLDDSDGDGLRDGFEVFVTFSDPMDEDGDNDGLTDYEEYRIYGTSLFTYDSDSDGLSDGQEVLTYGTDPMIWDTDSDSITEPDGNGDMTWPMSDYHEVMLYGTDPLITDMDADGITDAWELYLASGDIPWLDPIALDPTNNDTDQDLLLDGAELIITNQTDLTYPFLARSIVYPYNSSPVMQDSDGDTLIDYQEIMVFNTRPDSNDTDGDTLLDFWEVWVYNTSAISIDTDGDNLTDVEETLYEVWPYGPFPPANWSIGFTTENEKAEGDAPLNYSVLFNFTLGTLSYPDPVDSIKGARTYILAQESYLSSATDYDSDGDYLPDGAEVQLYQSNPMSFDTDNDGTWDTYEFDTDLDMLEDGIEFAIGMQMVPGGGIFNPDSDLDGLLDGVEVYVYGTNPASTDSDGDGYSDGLEVALDLDPLSTTTEAEYEAALEAAIVDEPTNFQILTPNAYSEVSDEIAVVVANFTPVESMWFRYDDGFGWNGNYSMMYMHDTGLWYSDEIIWPPGNITLEVFAEDTQGHIYSQTIYFSVPVFIAPIPWLIIGAVGAGVFGFLFLTLFGRHKGWWLKGGTKEGKKKTTRRKSSTKKEDDVAESTKKSSSKRSKRGGDKE